ncbi:MAG TPA: TolC family protein [Chitinophagaceae bacterium]|nr:TolC family protein [Chitinophagaceae bacterium]
MRNFVLIAIVLIQQITGGPLLAQQRPPSLQELTDSALKKDYSLANQQLDIELSQLEKEKLRNAFLPRVTISGSEAFTLSSISLRTKEIKIPQLNIAIEDSRNRFTSTSDVVGINTDAAMLLYSGGKIPWLKKAADEKIKAQTELTEQQRQDIISDVISAYDQLALLKQVRVVLNESEKRLAANMKIADKSFSYGLITKYERQKIEVAQAQLASRITEYEGKRSIVQEKLYWLTNISIERIASINNTLEPVTGIAAEEDVLNRPDIKALDAAIAAQSYKIRAEKTWFIPKIQALSSTKMSGSFWGRLNSSKPVLNGEKLSADMPSLFIMPMFNIGVGFSWNILDGHDGKHEVRKASIELVKFQNNKKDLFQKLEVNLTKCRSDYTVSTAQVNTMKKQQETASNALDQANKEYRSGLIKTSDLIDAEEDFENASLGIIQALYNQRRAAVELLKATGHLKPDSIK